MSFDKCLIQYYKTLFPLELLCLISTRNNVYPLSSLEIAFEIRPDKKVIMLRNVNGKIPYSFDSARDIRRFMVQRTVVALHMGAIYYCKKRSQAAMKLEREDAYLYNPAPLVFDLDASDFARTCVCKQHDMCRICCETFVLPAVDAIVKLCVQLDFKKILKVFSGGRGFHVWVLDDRAYQLLPSQRKNMCERLKKQGVELDADVTLNSAHLTKMPMTVHATTGNIARPIGDTFDIDKDIIHLNNVTVELIEGWTQQIKDVLNF